jgi:hypothetical protein
VSFQTVKAAMTNPTKSLRSEWTYIGEHWQKPKADTNPVKFILYVIAHPLSGYTNNPHPKPVNKCAQYSARGQSSKCKMPHRATN